MLVSVILAGGKGERFWPLSTIDNPKQCLSIISSKPMIKETADRLKPLIPQNKIFVSTGKHLHSKIKKVLPKVNYIIEPIGRDTAAAIGLSCIEVMKKAGDAIIFIETADHVYKNPKKYLSHIKMAAKEAEKGNIVLIGIKPTFANTGYGYIKQGKKIKGKFYELDKYKEKPTLAKAKQFLKSGKYLWNSGMFVFKASVMLEEIKKYMPKLYKGLMEIKKNSKNKEKVFKKLNKISIDYGIMEKSKKTVLLKGDFPWVDVGDWETMGDVHKKDKKGNVIFGKGVSIKSKGNIIVSDKLVATYGVNNLVIVDTKDALLVCDKKDAQKVKEIVHELKKKGFKKYV